MDGCLAVDEVTGASLNGGETGGTCGLRPASLLGITGCPDGGPAMFIAADQGAAALATVFQDDGAYR